MAYTDIGAGVSIVLVHGWAARGEFFSDLGRRLARNHRVLIPTLRAHPGSDSGRSPLTIATLGDDLADFAEALELTDFIAVGWSMGAMALWPAAPRLAHRLSGLIVEDMGPRLICNEDWPHGLAGNYSAADVADTLTEIRGDWPAYVTRFAPRMFAPSARDLCSDTIAWATRKMSEADPEAMALLWQSMAQQDFRGALAAIGCPTLVIRGRESQVYPEAAAAFVAGAVKHGELATIAGAGHVPHLEAPDVFFNHVEAFVRALRRPDLKSGGAVP